MGIGRRSSVGRRRPAVPRKLARPCKDGLQWEIFCGQEEDQQVQDCIGLRGKVQKNELGGRPSADRRRPTAPRLHETIKRS
jgi:hypothetical protein